MALKKATIIICKSYITIQSDRYIISSLPFRVHSFHRTRLKQTVKQLLTESLHAILPEVSYLLSQFFSVFPSSGVSLA